MLGTNCLIKKMNMLDFTCHKTLLLKLLAKIGARDLLLARGDYEYPNPQVFAKLDFPYVSMPQWLETEVTSGHPLVFPISWSMLKLEMKNGGYEKVSKDDVASLCNGWHSLSVSLRSQQFQDHILSKLIEAANYHEIVVKRKYIGDKDVFIPRANCLEEINLWLDINWPSKSIEF